MNEPVRSRPIPTGMLLDIAAGMEEPVDIAFRYGFSASEFARLSKSQEFLREIGTHRSENDKTGITARNKAGLMYDMLADQYFKKLMSEDTPIGQLAAGVETFATIGGRKPKASVDGPAGAQFSISFNIPAAGVALQQQARVVSVPAEVKASLLSSITFGGEDITDVEDLGADEAEL